MNNFLKITFVLFFSLLYFGCASTDDEIPEPVIRDFDEQYLTDQANIVLFLKTHSITYDTNFLVTGYDRVTFLDATSIWGSNEAVHKTNLLERSFTFKDKNYIIYYIKLAQGGGDYACDVDAVNVNYIGSTLPTSLETPVGAAFETDATKPLLNLTNLIVGWGEIFPSFNVATTLNSNDFGAGVMFIPSGFAYFSRAKTSIPSYTPLIFSFQLYGVTHLDQDNDGILSVNEDLNNDRYVTFDNSDGDSAPNYLDADDDGDNVLTALEIKRPNVIINGVSVDNGSFSYNGSLIDNPLTLYIDERQGVPNCSNDFTTPGRVRKYLDKNCQ
jgi:FKBP-type peptidyl-prolyl cis-trans isomerase FkpA